MKKIAIIGAGPAGVEAASLLAPKFEIHLFEKSANPMDNLLDKAYLFPDFSAAKELGESLTNKLTHNNIHLHTQREIVSITHKNNSWEVTDQNKNKEQVDAILLTTGYTPFKAELKEELGYKIYNGVITSLDMEQKILQKKIFNTMGENAQRVVFLQCVGSRDEKSGNNYCSKICCVTAVKQAIETRKILPHAEIYVFYMDLRMWGKGFEEMYRSAQEDYDIRFIRGRISEASSTFNNKVQIKAEDTLSGRPLKMTTDLLVLMVGMEASQGTKNLGTQCKICGKYGFIESQNPHIGDNKTDVHGIYVAGTCKKPMSLNDTINDARSAAWTLMQDLEN